MWFNLDAAEAYFNAGLTLWAEESALSEDSHIFDALPADALAIVAFEAFAQYLFDCEDVVAAEANLDAALANWDDCLTLWAEDSALILSSEWFFDFIIMYIFFKNTEFKVSGH